MKEKIGIFGSSAGVDPRIETTTQSLGEVLAARNPILITGACSGIPYQVAYAARQAGLEEIWGFSPGRNYEEQCALTPNDDNTIYSRIIYNPAGNPRLDRPRTAMKFRNVSSTDECDAGIIVSGRIGTMNEFTCLYDMEKVIGVLTGTGGTADFLPDYLRAISKPSNAVIHFSEKPDELVALVMEEVRKRQVNGN